MRVLVAVSVSLQLHRVGGQVVRYLVMEQDSFMMVGDIVGPVVLHSIGEIAQVNVPV